MKDRQKTNNTFSTTAEEVTDLSDAPRAIKEQILKNDKILKGGGEEEHSSKYHKDGAQAKQKIHLNISEMPTISSERSEEEVNTNSVKKLLQALADGRCKGIKSGYTYKIAQFAEEMGLI